MDVQYTIPEVKTPTPIIIIGAGDIVKHAHLPAYQIAGYQVMGIYDIDFEKAQKLATEYRIPNVYKDLQSCLVNTEVIYDLAVPGNQIAGLLTLLPEDSFVLIQKPMGDDLAQAKEIMEICHKRRLKAAVNFQLRYAPYIMMIKQMMELDLIGEIYDFEIYINVYTPWHIWTFLNQAPRVEMLYHSVHYIDLARNLLGDPLRIFAKTAKHPDMAQLASVRSNIIMDYGDRLRANILTNHAHKYGNEKQDAYLKIEGAKGAIKIKLGLLMNYPEGEPDKFEYLLHKNGHKSQWEELEIYGSWFPHGFIGSMAELMKYRNGETKAPDNAIENCFGTMEWLEAAYSC